ncbi:MAG: peptidoglycan DD-metalloendopeptidase family protein [Burkholderiales bacterium]|nr:peptidoglycan DD-metalloendopeptidase family protein [Burkholderiales bacterium]
MHQAQSAILAQNLLRLAFTKKLVRLIAAAVLPFVGVVAAFGIAPDTIIEQPAVVQVIEQVTLPVFAAHNNPEEAFWREEPIQRGDTVASLLARLQVDDPVAIKSVRGSREAKALYQLMPGRSLRVKTTADGKLLSLRYLNGNNLFSAERDENGYAVSEQPVQLEQRTQMASGTIRSSLFAATDAANLSDAVAIQIADIFSTDIDFHKDLRKGDRFTVVYEVFYHLGDTVRTGRVLAAEFINQGKSYQALHFQNAEGNGGYYTLEGKNIRKAFLRSPIEFSRISSGFSNARYHPVLKEWRAHKGVDYAAPTGTRVRVTADGVVEFAGRRGGYGNLVAVRHQSKFTTWYGHLSGFAKGLRKGSRVSQSDVIGYVGATGLATGPHLHYEFRINDVHQNPLRVVMPTAPPITADQKPAFDAVAQPMAQRLALLRGINTARLD